MAFYDIELLLNEGKALAVLRFFRKFAFQKYKF